jgi:vacuolar-type H+-ATPase subunit E/Vma4
VTNPSGGSDPYRTTPAPGEPATGDYAGEGSAVTDYSATDYQDGGYPVGAGIGVTSTGTGTNWPPSGDEGTSSTADVAKGEAANVKDTAVDAGKNVAATAKGEAANVVQETKQQAQSLLSTVTSEVRDQGRNQQQRIATAVNSLSKELGGMASGEQQSGPLTDLAQQASQKAEEIGRWLENREPSDVLEEVKRFARRRPVMFLGLSALAGVVVGRLARGAVAANTSLDSPDSGSGNRALTTSTQPSTYESAGYTSTYPSTYPATGDVPPTYGSTDPATYPTTSEPVYEDPAGRPDFTR